MVERGYKIIQDSLNGPIKISSEFQNLINTKEFQRLRYIKQLGMCYFVFPGANHTRFEHSIGTMFLAEMLSDTLKIEDRSLLMASALLHDVGHPPLSHGLEDVFQTITGMDHVDAGVSLIKGINGFEESEIPSALESMNISPSDVADVISGKSSRYRLISRIISGPIDVDELDYLRRDSLNCGVPIGNIDYKRILNVAEIHSNDVTIEEKGLPTLESILIARILMYGSVYFHKTSRIAQIMTKNLVMKQADDFLTPFSMTDYDLFWLLSNGKYSSAFRDIAYRKLLKPAVKIRFTQETYENVLSTMMDSRIDRMEYIVDVIPPIDFSGPERIKSDLHVLIDGSLQNVTEISPLVRTLKESLENRFIIVSTKTEELDYTRKLLKRFF